MGYNEALFWLAGANLLLIAVCYGLLAWSGRLVRHLRDLPVPSGKLPKVSIIVPARNEERNIREALRSLLALDYPDYELLVVNDRSTDRTGQILDEMAAQAPRLKVLHVGDLPAGWLGKNHAMHFAAQQARGELLLFTDADIVFEPTALARAVGYFEQQRLDHLAIGPETRMPSWLLSSFVVLFCILFYLYIRVWGIRNPKSTAHVGIGAFNLVRAEVFRRLGGFQPIAMRPDDDLKLGKLVKAGGCRQDLLAGAGMLSVEWYSSVRELAVGFEKNAFAAVDYNLPFVVLYTSSILVFNVWPFAAVFLTWGPTRWLYLACVLALWSMAWGCAREIRQPWHTALGFPVSALLLVLISWRSVLLTYWRGGIRWRDTHYSLAELRANRV
jgi:cellulose synthase/poly-beta-1,6-N-acetylglucosamine synthase-like glycosyltransferase